MFFSINKHIHYLQHIIIRLFLNVSVLLFEQDPAIPGYLPKELFKDLSETELCAIVCQRCHFLKHYNTALNVSVDQGEYTKLLSKIKNNKALIILMVDMTDFPCSIFPDIMKIIGKTNKYII